jgi:hypothetical protein
MCTGETAQRVHRPYSVRVAITVSGVDPAVAGNGTDTRATFEAAFATAVAESFSIVRGNIAIDTITVTPSSGTLRRWLQAAVGAAEAIISFSVKVDMEAAAAFIARLEEARNGTTAAPIEVGVDGAVAILSTLTEPTVVTLLVHDAPIGVQCREGHDPTSPLCHVCLDGAAQ